MSGDMVKMNSELSYWKETKVMEEKDKLENWAKPISLPKLAEIALETIDLLSTSLIRGPSKSTSKNLTD